MASNKLNATILLLSLLAYSLTFSHACCSCKSKPKTPPKAPCTTPPTTPTPTPTPTTPAAPAPASGKCPTDTLKLGVCADILGLVNVVVGSPASSQCCALLEGLADLDAALCLCTAIKANVLGINLNVPVTLSLLLSACQKDVPSGFKCA